MNIKMFASNVISLLKKTSGYCVYKDLLTKDFKKVTGIPFVKKNKSEHIHFVTISTRQYSDKPLISRIKDTAEDFKKIKEKEKKKRDFIEKITVIDVDGKINVLSMIEASNLAQRRDLKLVYLRDDTKSGRKEYKLVSKTDFLKGDLQKDLGNNEEKSKSTSLKKEKLVSFSSKIGENDVKSKIKQMHKWIEKRHEIRVVISIEPGDSAAAENIYKAVEAEFQTNGRVRQKIVRDNVLKFVILPPEVKSEKSKAVKKKKETAKPEESKEPVESS